MGAPGGAAADRQPGPAPRAVDQVEAGRTARKTARQGPRARNQRISAPFRPAFQQYPSNKARGAPQKRQKSAILSAHRIRALVDQLDAELEPAADQLGDAEPETFRQPRDQDGPSAPIGTGQRRPRGISAPYFNRKRQKSAAFAASRRGGYTLQPLCNRSATNKPLITHDNISWLQSYRNCLAYMRACPRVQACAHITRGYGLQPLQPARKPSDINRLMVTDQLHRGCACNRTPGPFGAPGLACQIHGTPTGRGQTRRERQRQRRPHQVTARGGPGEERAIAHRSRFASAAIAVGACGKLWIALLTWQFAAMLRSVDCSRIARCLTV